MGFLLIGLVIGIVVDRYVLPFCDMLLETFQYKTTNKCTAIQIDTNLMSLEYEQIANQGNQLTPAIGFTAGHDYGELIEEDDEDEQDRARIGFIK